MVEFNVVFILQSPVKILRYKKILVIFVASTQISSAAAATSCSSPSPSPPRLPRAPSDVPINVER